MSSTRHIWATSMEYIVTHTIYMYYITSHGHNSAVGLDQHVQFISAFIIMLFVCLPSQYMQTVIGQYCEAPATRLRYMTPLASGIGFSYIMVSYFRLFPNAVYAGDALLYGLNSFQTDLPWLTCGEFSKGNCWYNWSCPWYEPCLNPRMHLSTSLYWYEIFLGPDTTYWPDVRRFVTALVVWAIVYITLFASKKFINKSMRYMYLLMICFRLIVLIVLMWESGFNRFFMMLEISSDHLFNANTWARQMVAAIGFMSIGRGGNILLGSCFTQEQSSGTLSVFTIIGTIGVYLLNEESFFIAFGIIASHAKMKEPTADIIRSIFEQVEFTVIPAALGFVPLPQLWSMMYFLAIIINSICFLTINVRIITISLEESFPHLIKYRNFFLIISLLFNILMILPHVNKKSYMYMFPIMNYALDTFETVIALLFVLLVGWIYGVQKLCDDVHYIMGNQPTAFWKVTWYLNPVFIMTGFIFFILDPENVPYETTGGTIYVVSLISLLLCPIVCIGVYQMLRYIRFKNFSGVFQMTDEWGPGDMNERLTRRIFNPRKETKSRRRNEKCQHKCLLNSKVLNQVLAEESTWEINRERDSIKVREN